METTTYQQGTKVAHRRFPQIVGTVQHVFSDNELLILWDGSTDPDYYAADEVVTA